MSFYDQLNEFKTALRVARSGAADDNQVYEKVVGMANGVPLIGPYGIRADEWDTLTQVAGIPGARWQDRGAQEAVMDSQLTALYNRYGGRWDNVAIAWEAGTAVADRVALKGEPIKQVVKQGDQLEMFVSNVVGSMDTSEADPLDFAEMATFGSPFATTPLGSDRPQRPKAQVDPEHAVVEMLSALRDKQVARKEVESNGTPEIGEQGVGGNVTPGTAESSGI